LLAAILWLLERLGPSAWLWCWGATALFGLAAQLVVPRWILPLFNRFTPLEDGPLRQRLLEYAERVRFPIGRIFVVDGSRRSSRTNAFFAGFGASRRLALFDTLIARHPLEELVAVVAHEVGHWRRRHMSALLALGIAQSGALFFLVSLFLGNRALAAAFGIAEPNVACGLVFFGFLYGPIELLLSLASLALSRRHEIEADRFAAETTSAAAMADALLRLSRDNLTNLSPHPFSVVLHHSHPPILQRLRALRALKIAAPRLR
jgi:STE24 endopeptidase